MPVILETPVVPAAPSYDKVHLDHLTITQEPTDYAKAVIQARVRLYYQGDDGHKVFSTETRDIFIEDAAAVVTALAQQGDMRGVEGVGHITQLVALLVGIGTNLGAASAD